MQKETTITTTIPGTEKSVTTTVPVCDGTEVTKADIPLDFFSLWAKGTKLKFSGKSATTDVGYDIIVQAQPGQTFIPNNGALTAGGLASINFPQQQKSSVIFNFFEPGSTIPVAQKDSP